jgi:hypothetical protein
MPGRTVEEIAVEALQTIDRYNPDAPEVESWKWLAREFKSIARVALALIAEARKAGHHGSTEPCPQCSAVPECDDEGCYEPRTRPIHSSAMRRALAALPDAEKVYMCGCRLSQSCDQHALMRGLPYSEAGDKEGA